MALLKRVSRLFAKLHRWKSSHQYLGRYSIEKLYVFHDYSIGTSRWRVAGVLLLAPIPVLAVMLAMEAIPLNDPSAGLAHNGVTLFRSIVSHTVMTFAMLLSVKASIQLPDDGYSITSVGVIAALVSVTLELVWLPFMVFWRFPVPFKEFVGLVPFSLLVALFHWICAKRILVAHRTAFRRILPLLLAQLTLFYSFLGLSIGFAYVPLPGQVAMILGFPIAKVFLKKTVWRLAHSLGDLTTDVTICMVEISGALYQTVCLQHVQSQALSVLLMATDFIQAVAEVHMYMARDYIADNQSTLHTAVKIVETALFPGVAEVDKASAATLPSSQPTTASMPQPQRWIRPWFARRTSKVQSLPGPSAPPAAAVASSTSRSRAMRASFEAAAQSVLLPPAMLLNETRKQLLDLSAQSVATSTPHDTPGDDQVRHAVSALQIDGLAIERRDQARLLEQSLQLLFSSEVLLFVEFMEVFMPLVYGVYVGVAWHLPNAKYNYVLMDMTQAEMQQTVVSSLVYALLESVSLALMCWLMHRKYGIQSLYQLAFVLERYWMTLHGKLLGTFITIINSATVHQGIDFTFRFVYSQYSISVDSHG